MMKYKGYIGNVEYDADAKIFHGEVIGLHDIITFQGTSPQEIDKAFKDSVDDYIAWCKERGEKPEKTYSGQLRLRIEPSLHAQLAQQAALSGMSLNALINERLKAKL